MPRYKQVNNELIELTGSELAELEAKEQAWEDGALDRALEGLRHKRNRLLAETDWMANSDVTMSTAWRNYRQALRDITTQTPTDDALSNITFPTKPMS